MLRFNDEEWLRFLAMYEQTEVKAKAVFAKARIFGGEFPERWLPAGLAIVDEPFTEQNGLVNSTMKVVRNKVEEHFRDRLEYLYTPEGRDLKNPKNLASLKKIVD